MARPSKGGIRGARLNPQQTDRTRAAIQTTQIAKRLNQFILGEKNQGKVVEMTPAQVTAALGLLKKTIPDLQSVEGTLNLNHRHEDALKDLE